MGGQRHLASFSEYKVTSDSGCICALILIAFTECLRQVRGRVVLFPLNFLERLAVGGIHSAPFLFNHQMMNDDYVFSVQSPNLGIQMAQMVVKDLFQ